MFGRKSALHRQNSDSESGTPQAQPGSRAASVLRRLEDAARSEEAAGLRNLPWKPVPDSPLAPPVVDIDWLTTQPLLPYLVNVVPAPVLYRSLMAHGLEDAIEVLEHVRGDQLVRVLDYDLWTPDAEQGTEDVTLDRVMNWLRVWNEVSPEFAAARLGDLEEETLVSVLTKVFHIHPVGLYDKEKEEEPSEDHWLTPDKRFFVKVVEGGPEAYELLRQIVLAWYGKDQRFASSAFAHAAMLVRQEALEDALRWRAGRLADAGFVAREDARRALAPRPLEKVRADVRAALAREAEIEARRQERARKGRSEGGPNAENTENTEIAKSAEDDAHAGAQIDPETFEGVVKVLQSMESEVGYAEVVRVLGQKDVNLLAGSSAPLPDLVMEDQDIVNEAAEKIISECARLLAFVQAAPLRNETKQQLLVEKCFGRMAIEDPQRAGELKGRLARVSNTVLAAADGQLSGDALDRSLTVTRGALNIGLETILAEPGSFGLALEGAADVEAGTAGGTAPDDAVARALDVVTKVGPEFLFQVGWQSLQDVSVTVAEQITGLARSGDPRFAHLAWTREVTLLDGGSVSFTLDSFVRTGRFTEVRAFLGQLESRLPPAVHLALSALLNRVPLFPDWLATLGQAGASAFSAPSTLRAFETRDDVNAVKRFLSELPANMMAGG